MAITINSNPSALQGFLGIQQEQQNLFAKISSAKQINSAADNAAGLAIAVKFTAQIEGFSTAISNASDGISLAQTGAASLGSVTDNLQRIRELAVQAGNSILDGPSRDALENEANALRDEITRISENTSFNGQNILANTRTHDFQIGGNSGETLSLNAVDIDAEIDDAGLAQLDFSSAASASGFLNAIDTSLSQVSSLASTFGAFQNALVSTVNDLSQQFISTSAARSRIEDTDYAKESAALVSNKVRQQAGIAVQVQANANKSIVNQLLA